MRGVGTRHAAMGRKGVLGSIDGAHRFIQTGPTKIFATVVVTIELALALNNTLSSTKGATSCATAVCVHEPRTLAVHVVCAATVHGQVPAELDAQVELLRVPVPVPVLVSVPVSVPVPVSVVVPFPVPVPVPVPVRCALCAVFVAYACTWCP